MAELSAQPRLARTRDVQGSSKRGPRGSQRKGEAQQATAAGLDLLRVLGWLVLHDVTLPADPATREPEVLIDHVLAGPSGCVLGKGDPFGPPRSGRAVLSPGLQPGSDRDNRVNLTGSADPGGEGQRQ